VPRQFHLKNEHSGMDRDAVNLGGYSIKVQIDAEIMSNSNKPSAKLYDECKFNHCLPTRRRLRYSTDMHVNFSSTS
jgi:hypothetical protein